MGRRSADVCLHSPFPPSLSQDSAQSIVQAWLREALGGIQASEWFRVQNGGATVLRKLLPAAGSTLLSAGRLARGRMVAGRCWDFMVPQVVHEILLSSRSFCFPIALLCFLTLLLLNQTVHAFWLPLVLCDFGVN